MFNNYKIIRNAKGQFILKTNFWSATKYHAQKVRNIILGAIIMAFIVSTSYTIGKDQSLVAKLAYASNTGLSVEFTDTLQGKIDSLQNEVVEYLALHENKTNVPCVPDDNRDHSLPLKDKVSCGVMQFKIGTIQHYYSVLKLGTISDQDAVILAIDPVRAKALAKRVIFETTGGIYNWTTATPEIIQKVAIVKELMK